MGHGDPHPVASGGAWGKIWGVAAWRRGGVGFVGFVGCVRCDGCFGKLRRSVPTVTQIGYRGGGDSMNSIDRTPTPLRSVMAFILPMLVNIAAARAARTPSSYAINREQPLCDADYGLAYQTWVKNSERQPTLAAFIQVHATTPFFQTAFLFFHIDILSRSIAT